GGLFSLSRERLEELKSTVRDKIIGPAKSLIAELGLEVAGVHLIQDTPAPGLAQLARSVGVDLIVIGRSGAGWVERVCCGSVSQRLTSRGPCAMLVVPRASLHRKGEPISFVVAVDFGEETLKGVELTEALARESQADIDLIHSLAPHDIISIDFDALDSYVSEVLNYKADLQNQLDNIAAGLLEKGLSVRSKVMPESIVEGLMSTAKGHFNAVIVVATHGRRGMKKLWSGSNADELLSRTEHPVLVVPVHSKAEVKSEA
ncbi:MAG: universal stress protein, partial [Planctomycetota bacterium]|nr:universal stress protein [Planctomycetota bacterium]